MKAISTQEAQRLEQLVRGHQSSVRGYLQFLGCPSSLVDDVLQEVFLSVLAARFDDRGEAATSAFLRRVARNLFLKTLRRQRREPPASDLAAADEVWLGFERDDQGEGYLDALRQCLRTLGSRARDVLRRRYQEKDSQAGIASALGLKESGVKSILVRSKKRLRDCIERRLAG